MFAGQVRRTTPVLSGKCWNATVTLVLSFSLFACRVVEVTTHHSPCESGAIKNQELNGDFWVFWLSLAYEELAPSLGMCCGKNINWVK